ncbi:GNAT family N-acetyltransferase [Thermodesulfobacteriota bacterium]
MQQNSAGVRLFHFDEERFGMRSARAYIDSPEALYESETFCRTHSVRFLVARVPADWIRIIQQMEQAGFLLMDTLVYYNRDLTRSPLPSDECEIPIRLIRKGEEETIGAIAKQTYKRYFGHYHADPRLDSAKCDEGYVDWAYRSCIDKNMADEVLVAEQDGKIVGFVTLRANDDIEGEVVVGGVIPEAREKGIYRSFILNAMKRFQKKGLKQTLVSTQIINVAVQKVWARLGFEFLTSFYTFHKWYD